MQVPLAEVEELWPIDHMAADSQRTGCCVAQERTIGVYFSMKGDPLQTPSSASPIGSKNRWSSGHTNCLSQLARPSNALRVSHSRTGSTIQPCHRQNPPWGAIVTEDSADFSFHSTFYLFSAGSFPLVYLGYDVLSCWPPAIWHPDPQAQPCIAVRSFLPRQSFELPRSLTPTEP